VNSLPAIPRPPTVPDQDWEVSADLARKPRPLVRNRILGCFVKLLKPRDQASAARHGTTSLWFSSTPQMWPAYDQPARMPEELKARSKYPTHARVLRVDREQCATAANLEILRHE